ncbi:hypothetical protein Goari_004646, partial [Gossypium aridum]|nr:hypothetical protein [Gossypium aridum]
MFSCRNDYSQDDIKEIQCYICKSFGHICFINFVDTSPREVSCYRCGQLGHTGLVGKRNRESSTPNLRSRLENKDLLGYKTGPHDNGKSRCKRKKIQFEEKGFNTPRKEKKGGGWITEDPGDFSYRKSTRSHWNSPSTPSNQGCYNGHILGSQSSKPKNFHRFSASRFSNLGNDEPRRTYNW